MTRSVWLALAMTALIAAFTAVGIMNASVPATPAEITAAVRGADPACATLLKDRLRMRIAAKGALSRRSLDTIAHMECGTAGPQYRASGG